MTRLARSVAMPDGVTTTTVVNDGTLKEGVDRFVAALRLCLPGFRRDADWSAIFELRRSAAQPGGDYGLAAN